MSVATARFYSMPGSVSSGEFPLLAANQNIASYLKNTASVKYADGLQTRIRVPSFEDYDKVNLIDLDGKWYWATAFHEVSTYSGQIEYTLDFNAPTSFIRSGDSIKGNWKKTADNQCPYMHQVIANSVMSEAGSLELPRIEPPGTLTSQPGIHVFWVQITGYDSNNDILRRGMFIPFDDRFGLYHDDEHIYYDNLGHEYPNYVDLITNIYAYTGILAENVLDVSISVRCPYEYERGVYQSGLISSYWYGIRNKAATLVNGYYVYDLNQRISQIGQTIRLSLNEDQILLGSVVVKDYNRNTIMEVPTGLATKRTNDWVMAFTIMTHADLEGIYTTIEFRDMSITIPEGHLLYLGNTWETYKAYQMNTDRMMMDNAINYARIQQETDNQVGAMNASISGMFTAAIGVAGADVTNAGLSAVGTAAIGAAQTAAETALAYYESQRNFELTELKARDNFELSQKKAINQPQTAYNVGYGGVYCWNNTQYPSHLGILMPENIDSTYIDNWFEQMGYSAEGIITLTAKAGFYQGMLLNDGSHTGMYFDELNKTFMKGFKFITP